MHFTSFFLLALPVVFALPSPFPPQTPADAAFPDQGAGTHGMGSPKMINKVVKRVDLAVGMKNGELDAEGQDEGKKDSGIHLAVTPQISKRTIPVMPGKDQKQNGYPQKGDFHPGLNHGGDVKAKGANDEQPSMAGAGNAGVGTGA